VALIAASDDLVPPSRDDLMRNELDAEEKQVVMRRPALLWFQLPDILF